MTSIVEFANDTNLQRNPDESGHSANLSTTTYVQLRPISMKQLRGAWHDFNKKFRALLISLLTRSATDAMSSFGKLDLSIHTIRRFPTLELGLVRELGSDRFTYFRPNAVIQGLIAIRAVPPKTPHGKPRKNIRNLDGILNALEETDRKHLISEILSANCCLDDVLKLHQSSLVGDLEIDKYLATETSSPDALETIARCTEAFFNEQKTRIESGEGHGRIFGWAWFSQYLSTEGVWLQPVSHITDILNLYPKKIRPVACWMAVPSRYWEIGNLVWSRMEASRSTSAANILNVYLTIAQSSTAFQGHGLVEWPLVYFKRWAQTHRTSGELRSASTNHLYRLLCEYHGLVAAEQATAPHFLGRRRTAKTGVVAFEWCENPSNRNTKLVERCIGHTVRQVPLFIRDWAESFRELLPLFGTKSVKNQMEELNTWLIFMLHLGEQDAPKSFREVVRSRHINDRKPNSSTYVNFLARHFSESKKGNAYRAPSTMAHAFQLAAIRDHFHDQTPNPFDVDMDRAGEAPARHGKTTRRPLDREVMDIIVRENRRNDFQFARELGTRRKPHFKMCKNRHTGIYESVFFPLAPVIIDIILHSGMRKYQARWLDSGEGDMEIVDQSTKMHKPNSAPTATVARRQGFIRLFEFSEKGGRRRELGMFVNTNKTGDPFDVPWIDPIIAANVERIAILQATYNPIQSPILAKEIDLSANYTGSRPFPTVFPLFRNPDYDMHQPVSDFIVANYWHDLLVHCEPIVERELGYPYPLIRGGNPVFDIHSIRVTTVTVLHEAGVPIEYIQALVGHSALVMTWYYRQVRYSEIHKALNSGYTKRGETAASPDPLAKEILDEAVESPDADDPIGRTLLQEHRSSRAAPTDVFAHGLCPGGDCSIGGKRISAGRHAPVFRPRACSRCRFRVTGPKFLNGLGSRVNALMLEAKYSQEIEVRLNAEADQAEDNGKPVAHLRAQARRERELRDSLWAEWASESKTLKLCEGILDANPDTERSVYTLISQSSEFDQQHAGAQFRIVHQFELENNLVVFARTHPEMQIDLPIGTEEKRDNQLYRLLLMNKREDLLLAISSDKSKRAFDAFGNWLIAGSSSHGQLQEILEGHLLFEDVPSLCNLDEALSLATPESSVLEHEAHG
ncbi:VPA1269 family protein [Tardiphaga sp. P9-11]|uniref:VPA1269 family protein n=1 Tax=Tardiphaga sp. P9-11 TaxID=2024614 RepID=UPI0011F28603|nr:VPA1269 family protein [Tardiphaga sp. P9-11]KAA0073979.1 hypothetical protein CIW50_18750 [Tardiphaga sp. P9-11]